MHLLTLAKGVPRPDNRGLISVGRTRLRRAVANAIGKVHICAKARDISLRTAAQLDCLAKHAGDTILLNQPLIE